MDERNRCGTVAALWRYPVKSLQGVAVDVLPVGASGPVGDRRWAILRDGAPLSAKRVPALLLAGAREDGDAGELILPDGTLTHSGDSDVDALLSDWLGASVTLGEAADRFVDDEAVHLLTTASLAAMRALRPGDWDARRFRPNVLVEVDGAERAEHGWVGRRLSLGAVSVEVLQPTVRCAMTGMAQPALPGDPEVLRTLAARTDAELGVYARVLVAGEVRVGDPVALR
jgi:uncharacterized protein YcbX